MIKSVLPAYTSRSADLQPVFHGFEHQRAVCCTSVRGFHRRAFPAGFCADAVLLRSPPCATSVHGYV